jgi:hypothetical protein
MPRCKNCKEKFEPIRFNMKYCTEIICLRAFSDDIKAKQWQKTKQKMKADLETVQDIVKAAQMVFNKYIRERDKDELCISCKQKPKKENAGHFYNANNHWNVRFDEDNVHLQCERCNSFLSGNLIEYRANLISKIGQERFDQLESRARLTRKFTKDELKELVKKYKEMYNQLK